ncbi:MAG TPA: DUF1501 domain-containing protein [Gemmataceae bacterium]|jgi:hypothetical protein|nr:DUF1501 domain-containing protein [Gemmataceae bacterium]
MSTTVPTASNLGTRRQFLQTSGLGALGLFWANWCRAQETQSQGRQAKAKSVILIFNCGAPSHTDLWDMKPAAPDNIRGQFKPIATNVPGIQISELMPKLARQTDRLAIVRSVHHTQTQHNTGMYYSIVGKPYGIDSTLINPSRTDYPSFGTLVGWLARRDGYSSPLPPYVITPFPHCDSTVYITPGQYGGCLGTRYDPLVLNTDPNAANFRAPNLSLADDLTPARLHERQNLLEHLDERVNFNDRTRFADLDLNRAKAIDLVTSSSVQRAFDLSLEPPAVRDRYGRHSWGQSHLLARRLVEAGVRFVTTVNGPSIIWDTHADNFNRLKTKLVPPMESGFAALLEDLHDRGLLESTLVIWMGDFGRTPTINKDAGRDHWPQCYTMVLAGGGIRGGQYIGSSDQHGAFPKEYPITPADVHASVFTALGYDPHAITYLSPEGRPFPLSDGEPIRGLL